MFVVTVPYPDVPLAAPKLRTPPATLTVAVELFAAVPTNVMVFTFSVPFVMLRPPTLLAPLASVRVVTVAVALPDMLNVPMLPAPFAIVTVVTVTVESPDMLRTPVLFVELPIVAVVINAVDVPEMLMVAILFVPLPMFAVGTVSPELPEMFTYPLALPALAILRLPGTASALSVTLSAPVLPPRSPT
jgi:hypothetical protein